MKTLAQELHHQLFALALGSLGILMAHEAAAADSDFFAEFPDQLEFPLIVLQPLNQLVAVGDTAVFEVAAENGPLTYQWLRNGSVIPGATNAALKVEQVSVDDVGQYSCNVAKGLEIVPTRGAQLMVYGRQQSSELRFGGAEALLSGGSIYVSALPVASSGSSGSCPGAYAGYVNYTKTIAQGWGWAPSTGMTTHTATDQNRSDTKTQYWGKLGDIGCDQTTVAVPDPTFSTKYRFAIYFANNVPTNAYSITLDGFDP